MARQVDPFVITYWNAAQLFAWVYRGDRHSVLIASDGSHELRTFFERHKFTNGEYTWVERTLGKPGLSRLAVAAALFGASQSFDEAKAAILEALQAGRIRAWGIRDGSDELRLIDPVQWCDLGFYEDRHEAIYAAPQDIERRFSFKWTGLRFLKAEVLAEWPDPLSVLAESDEAPLSIGGKTTIAAENACRKKLATLMRNGPPEKPKADYQKDFGIGKRAFDRAWGNALADVGPELAAPWIKTGPKKKSSE
ncbi:hypothetical protein A6A04_14795 [Paramagnetospirillum marisnigri]|uniref:Uncharacterized protein n=1 Tax=Paramagnetospirillum marisnigri TaxID=1285242 RepID=A0A178MTT6_9PROT|nr:hypothetical protein [Paramagnetospirillum marisnigri]OAN52982.1 hypothetical protein A6A04_14795 [Paramagnetospirillum marisnigri]